jgi:heme-binding NEAT domain protein
MAPKKTKTVKQTKATAASKATPPAKKVTAASMRLIKKAIEQKLAPVAAKVDIQIPQPQQDVSIDKSA